MAMLYLGKYLIVIIAIICFVSCERNDKSQLYKEKSNQIASEEEYYLVYNSLNDSIKNWKKNNLFGFRYLVNTWKTDSLICFNKTNDRLVVALAYQNNFYPNSSADHLINFYGAKFNNKWYFFSGGSYMLPRDYYGSDTNAPLSFEKLHEIALDKVYSGYLIKKDKGFWANLFGKTEWELNDDFFKGMESRNTDGSYGGNLKTFKECVIYQVNYKWKKIDKDGYIKYDHPTPEEMER